MLLITARIGKPIYIGDMELVLVQVRGICAKLSVRGAHQEPLLVCRKDGGSASFSGTVSASEGDALDVGPVHILVSQIRGPQVRLGIDAPRDVRISTATLEAARKAKEGRVCATSTP